MNDYFIDDFNVVLRVLFGCLCWLRCSRWPHAGLTLASPPSIVLASFQVSF
jgi:hypothetical protein